MHNYKNPVGGIVTWMLIGQVQRLIWIQMDMIKSSQKHRYFQTTGKYWYLKIFKLLLHLTLALDQRKWKYIYKFLKKDTE